MRCVDTPRIYPTGARQDLGDSEFAANESVTVGLAFFELDSKAIERRFLIASRHRPCSQMYRGAKWKRFSSASSLTGKATST